MKAICIENPGNIFVKDIEKPTLRQGMALINVKSMGVCGSDVAAYRYKHPNCNYPLIIGHEICGIVEEIAASDNSLDFKVGDRVVLDPYMYCGSCYPCSQGRTNCCESLKCLGVQTDGAMCEYFLHPINQLVHVPEGISWADAPLSEPLTIALHAIHRIRPQKGEHVTVIGAGTIGIMAALVAEIYGAVPILVDIENGRLKLADEFGVKNTINSIETDAEAEIGRLTNGRMSETVIEASGADAGVRACLNYAAYTGRIALTGWPKGEVSLPTGIITRKELQILGSRTSVNEFQEALDLMAQNKIDVSRFISLAVEFENLPEAIMEQANHPEKYLKIVGLL